MDVLVDVVVLSAEGAGTEGLVSPTSMAGVVALTLLTLSSDGISLLRSIAFGSNINTPHFLNPFFTGHRKCFFKSDLEDCREIFLAYRHWCLGDHRCKLNKIGHVRKGCLQWSKD